MKMLYFSADRMEIAVVSKAFTNAGIACEARESGVGRVLMPDPGEAELWIQHDEDAYKALMLCVELGIGFAKRSEAVDSAVRYPSWDVEQQEPTETEEVKREI